MFYGEAVFSLQGMAAVLGLNASSIQWETYDPILSPYLLWQNMHSANTSYRKSAIKPFVAVWCNGDKDRAFPYMLAQQGIPSGGHGKVSIGCPKSLHNIQHHENHSYCGIQAVVPSSSAWFTHWKNSVINHASKSTMCCGLFWNSHNMAWTLQV